MTSVGIADVFYSNIFNTREDMTFCVFWFAGSPPENVLQQPSGNILLVNVNSDGGDIY